MSRQTKADLLKEIEELKEHLKASFKANDRLIKEKAELIDKADNKFKNSCTYKQMLKEIDTLNLYLKTRDNTINTYKTRCAKNEATIQELLQEIKYLKADNRRTLEFAVEEMEKLNSNNVQKIKNERNAGRKSKINDDIIRAVTMLRLQNKSIRAIAKEVNLSLGTVQKIINEHMEI